MVRLSALLLTAAQIASCSVAAVSRSKMPCFAVPPFSAARTNSRQYLQPIPVEQRAAQTDRAMHVCGLISSQLAASNNQFSDDPSDGSDADQRKRKGIRRFVPSLFKRSSPSPSSTLQSKANKRQRLKKAAAASLTFLYLALFRLRPAWANPVLHDAQSYDRPVSTAAVSTARRDDDRMVVPCKAAVSIRPGATLEEIQSGSQSDSTDRAVMGDFAIGKGEASAASPASSVDGTKLSRKERRALKKKQKQQQQKKKRRGDWEYDDEEDDEEEDYVDDAIDDLGAAAAGMGAGMSPGMSPGMSAGPPGRMSAPPGASSISAKAKSSIQTKVILIAGGGYALSCISYEGFQWNKEQKKVETSIEILGEQAKELGLVGMNDENATATDEEIADELRNMGNETDTSEGDEDGEGGSESDDDDDDDDEPEPPRSRRSPRKPIRPSDDDDDDDDYGGSGGAGDGRPSTDDLDRLNRMFKK